MKRMLVFEDNMLSEIGRVCLVAMMQSQIVGTVQAYTEQIWDNRVGESYLAEICEC